MKASMVRDLAIQAAPDRYVGPRLPDFTWTGSIFAPKSGDAGSSLCAVT
jgi:hypothetical protein